MKKNEDIVCNVKACVYNAEGKNCKRKGIAVICGKGENCARCGDYSEKK